MNHFDDSNFLNPYQFPGWPTSTVRGCRSSSAKKFTSSNQNQHENSPRQCFVQRSIHIPTETRVRTPPPLYPPTPTPDLYSIDDQESSVSSMIPSSRLTPVRIKSATLTVPIKTNSDETIQNSFAQQSHERRKIVQERKLRKQLAHKYSHLDSDVWLQLRQASAPFKSLTTTPAITEEHSTDRNASRLSCEKYSFETFKQETNQQEKDKQMNILKTKTDSRPTSNIRLRPNTSRPRNTLSYSQMIKRQSEIDLQPAFEPFMVAAKPLHPSLLICNINPSKSRFKLTKPPSSAPPRFRSSPSSVLKPAPVEKIDQLLISNPIPPDNPSIPLEIVKEEEKEEEVNSSIPIISEISPRPKTASNISLKSTIKLQTQISRCRSANDTKSSFTLNKIPLRFILITDDEHRIESWYHQYPFIISEDFLQSFQVKPNKSTIAAYFIDDYSHSLNYNKITNGQLQNKPFHINNDWKKYDLIFISDKIYRDVIIYLQTIINLIIKSSGKIIHIFQVNHNDDLKTQVTTICKQLNT
ncbi:unnamed protein product [Adineta steineri]|uniref:Uncharacterized protein n=1 Tax=Adineta steineri TaxID=433720 RepID=A0A816DTE2_9BILA|nr:unnamed protein product [Adineta steineri]CAF1640794.1 unnamed protein product [Adineta steineri]